MAMNHIPFQDGLSMPEFFQRFGNEPQCAAALEAARWPHGFCCPCGGKTAHGVLRGGSGKGFQCNACRHQTLRIADTVFQGSKLPLTVGFLAISLDGSVGAGTEAAPGGGRSHRLVDPPQADAGDGTERSAPSARRRGAGR